jgi:hypothetical protein
LRCSLQPSALRQAPAQPIKSGVAAQPKSNPKTNKTPRQRQSRPRGDTIPPPKINDPMPRVAPKQNDPMPQVKPDPNGTPSVQPPDPQNRPVKPPDPTRPTTKKP